MGRKGKTARLKRKPAPRFWPIHRKEELWVIKPSAGPHGLQNCLPLSLVIRDILGLAKTRREVQIEIHQRKILVDGKVQKDDYPVGLMDTISITDANQYYRVVPSHKGLSLTPINKEEAGFKLCRVENKTTVPGGVQLNLHDGSNLLVRLADSTNLQEAKYSTYDVLKVNLSTKEIIERVPLKVGNLAVITGGKNIGINGKIAEIEKTEAKKRRNALVVIEDENGNRFQTILDFIFSLDQNQPLVSAMEAGTVV